MKNLKDYKKVMKDQLTQRVIEILRDLVVMPWSELRIKRVAIQITKGLKQELERWTEEQATQKEFIHEKCIILLQIKNYLTYEKPK